MKNKLINLALYVISACSWFVLNAFDENSTLCKKLTRWSVLGLLSLSAMIVIRVGCTIIEKFNQ